MPRLETAIDDGETVVVTASHDGYERLAGTPRHRRRVTDHEVEVVDEVGGEGDHTVVACIMFAPGTAVEPLGEGHFRAGVTEVSLTSGAEVAEAFGDLRQGPRLSISAGGPLPHRYDTLLRRR